jgi:hypothetical protein
MPIDDDDDDWFNVGVIRNVDLNSNFVTDAI